MLVLMCTRLGDRRTRLGDRRQHLGYCLGMRAQQLLSRRGFAAANISACCGWAAATISPCAPAATIPAGEGRGYHLGRAGSWLLSWQGSAAATTTVSRQGGAAPRLLSRRRLRPGGCRGAATMHLGVRRGRLRYRLLPQHGQLRHSLCLGLHIGSALRAACRLGWTLRLGSAVATAHLGCGPTQRQPGKDPRRRRGQTKL